MNTPAYRDHTLTVYLGDCLHILPELPDGSVDAVVTDPPYALGFMGRKWDTFTGEDIGRGAQARTQRAAEVTPEGRGHSTSAGPYLASGVDSLRAAGEPFQQWCQLWAAECLRILKPGGHMLAFGGTRTWHRLACAVEDAGFQIRDSIAWMYGSGFPKSLDVSKAIDKAAARTWQGWGTALKPAHEPIVVARKPLAGTVAATVLAYGTGALNIDACRIGETVETWPTSRSFTSGISSGYTDGITKGATQATGSAPAGRWPANVVLDQTQAAALDQMSGETVSVRNSGRNGADQAEATWGLNRTDDLERGHNDSGGASRFFYVAKADQAERIRLDGTAHPTVKPLALMRWLTRLITPPGGTILEPFAGSGTTVEAAILEGFHCIAIEREPDYLPVIVQRINRRRDPVKAVTATGQDLGLFALLDDTDTP